MSVSNFEFKSASNPIVQFITGSKTFEGSMQSNGKPSIVSCLKWDGSYKTGADQEHSQNAIRTGVDRIIIQFIQQENEPIKYSDEYIPTDGIEVSHVAVTKDGTWISDKSRQVIVELVKNGDNNEWLFGNLQIPGNTSVNPNEVMDFTINNYTFNIKFKWNQYHNKQN
jgi:hypothetical protein